MSEGNQQFQLPLSVRSGDPRAPRAARRKPGQHSSAERVLAIDLVLGTHDIERITGRHRCTIYRWVRQGTFPGKRAGAGRGWLRSDVERWLHGDFAPSAVAVSEARPASGAETRAAARQVADFEA
jgi:predicted DNA-binding transcriptional regulator AlpA